MKILADASLPGLKIAFPHPFVLSLYHNPEEIPRLLTNQEVLLCRSTLTVNEKLLQNHRLHTVATASSGTDHLDQEYLKTQGIRSLDAKGANAPSVADYVLSTLAYLDKTGILQGKQVGIIGMGHVGTQVANRLAAADFSLYYYDPPRATQELSFHSVPQEALYACDVLCLHTQWHNTLPYPSHHLVNKNFLARLKPGCILINAARGEIVEEEAILTNPQRLYYCTDVYQNEPNIHAQLLAKATLCTPHIAGHSLEAKYAAVAYVSKKLHDLAKLASPIFALPPAPTQRLCLPSLTQPNSKLNLILGRSEEYSNKLFEGSYAQDILSAPNNWQDLVLSLYNPYEETMALKKAQDKASTFLTLRKKHHTRHDFATYIIGV